ncbi:hypothetical protein [Klebsiella aerogenes]|uniref:hypothetical protein n=1 Tax=Klebsiella aerogenes TaxID=548 RepID=UPI0030F90862
MEHSVLELEGRRYTADPGLYDYTIRKNRPVLSDGGPDAVPGLRLSRLFRRSFAPDRRSFLCDKPDSIMDHLSPVNHIRKVDFTMEMNCTSSALMSLKLSWMLTSFALMAGIAVKNLKILPPGMKRWSAGFAAMM